MSIQVGIWNCDGKAVDRTLLAAFNNALICQGPDGEASLLEHDIGMLYRPFHTTAESRREKQPFISASGVVLMWDGRLDNREDLTVDTRLDCKSSLTDVQIAAAAFEKWGTDCFPRFIGDWAVSVWQPRDRKLILAVDYLAVRHIFYYKCRNFVWWSSDLAPLVLLSKEKFRINDDYVAGYFAGYPESYLTPYQHIHQIPAGHFVRISEEGSHVERYWRYSPDPSFQAKSDAEYEEQFRDLFRQSVRRRLRSDSPILAELSGGLDSSSIVCVADQIAAEGRKDSPRVDTLSFCDSGKSESDDWIYIREIEQKRGRAGIHIDAEVPSDLTLSSDLHFLALPGYVAVGSLQQQRADAVSNGGYRIVLSGSGGDEFMGGIPDPSPYLADLLVTLRMRSLAQQLKAWSLTKRKPGIHLLLESLTLLLPLTIQRHISKRAAVEPWIRKEFAQRTALAKRMLGLQGTHGLPTARAYMGTILSMANRLAKLPCPYPVAEEIRYPYLDQNLVEFILSIPADQLLRPGERRSLMRRSLSGIVPTSILNRRTKQFGFRRPALALANNWDRLADFANFSAAGSLGYIDSHALVNALRAAKNGKRVPLVRLLKAVSMEYWLRDLMARQLLDEPAIMQIKQSKALIKAHEPTFRTSFRGAG